MFARVVSVRINPGKLDDAIAIQKGQDMPLDRQQPGYRGGYLLVDRTANTVMDISLWDSEEDVLAANKVIADRIGPMYEGILAEKVIPTWYEVAAQ